LREIESSHKYQNPDAVKEYAILFAYKFCHSCEEPIYRNEGYNFL